jgi:hypothetical protein
VTRTAEERFREKFQVDEATGCWVWTASRFPAGYGQFRWSPAKNGYAHIWAYEHYIGPVPEGLELDHTCRRRECCNPEHLEPVTHLENLMRSPVAPAATNAAKTKCKRGHELTEANTYISRRGERICRPCQRAHQLAWKEANPERHRAIWQRSYMKRRGTQLEAKPPARTD